MKRYVLWILVVILITGCAAPEREKQMPEPTVRPIGDFLYPVPPAWQRDYGDSAETQLYHNVAVLLAWVRQYEPQIERQRTVLEGLTGRVDALETVDVNDVNDVAGGDPND